MVADTDGWLTGSKALISHVLLESPDWDTRRFPVRFTQQQIEDSPNQKLQTVLYVLGLGARTGVCRSGSPVAVPDDYACACWMEHRNVHLRVVLSRA